MKGDRAMQFYLVLALLFAISVAMFAVQNATPVDISFFVFEFQKISLVIVIFTSALIGAVIIFLLNLVKQISLRRRINALEKKNEALETELEMLKNSQEAVEQTEAIQMDEKRTEEH
ncbi:MAG: LapA family protein [Desulfitobacteriaceae bacterium]|nr:LapA family protein [Desulfitobacteriaceae bacterium]